VQFSEVSVVQFSSVSVAQFSSASVMQFSLVSVMPFSLVSVARFSLVSFGRGAAIGRARPPGCSTRIHRSASKYPHSSHVSKSRRGTRHGYRWPCRAVQGRAGPCRAVPRRLSSPRGALAASHLSTSLPLYLSTCLTTRRRGATSSGSCTSGMKSLAGGREVES
jgi:hypothetical protein